MKQIEPYRAAAEAGSSERQARGQALLDAGKVGCLLLAGGQGSRLGFDGPKGCFPINGKSLFQHFAEMTPDLPLAILTSPTNHQATLDHFTAHDNFGLSRLSFCTQSELPLLDEDGQPVPDLSGADGNGTAFLHLVESGIWAEWQAQGIECITTALIDNPLGHPFDPELIGFLAETGGEIVIKAIPRADPNEHVGVLVRRSGHLAVVEYSEMPALDIDQFPCANLSLFALTIPFVHHIATHTSGLPYHLAHKPLPGRPHLYKREKFIFDALPLASTAEAILYRRKSCFAPLKRPSDLPLVAAALSDR